MVLNESKESSVLPDRLALLQKSVDSLALILAIEQVDESLAFQGQCRAPRYPLARLVDQAFAVRDRSRTQGRGALRQVERGLPRLAARDHLFDQANAQCGLGIHPLVG